MSVLTEPLSLNEIVEKTAKGEQVEGIVSMSLSWLIHHDYDDCYDALSTKLIGSPDLMNLNYSIVGQEGEDILLLRVIGDAVHFFDD